MAQIDTDAIDWTKGDGLVPAIIQNAASGQVLMLGYMDRAALDATVSSGKVTFFSRSKNRLWVKGETSGHWLNFVSAEMDCDNDALLVQASPQGPTCHTGAVSCFTDKKAPDVAFLGQLAALVADRHTARPQGSYTTSLFAAGKARIAQKVGEEGVELALARMKDDKVEMANEAADLLFHMLVLLQDADLQLDDVIAVLRTRHGQ
jgi:phosphoribosyl-ATP pyrophosphohydrolase/phosphoribosyl-AMP cyclohydrolase